MISTTNITIDFWQFVMGIGGVIALLVTMLLVAGRMLLGQLDKRSEERDATRREELKLRDESLQRRLSDQDDELSSVSKKADQIERDMRQLSMMLPNEYVRREDWIRFSGTIDTKLDWLRDKQDDMRNAVTQLAERLKVYVGDSNDR